MERRTEVRLLVNQPARLTVLAEDSSSLQPIEVTVANVSSRGFHLFSPVPVAAGSPIRLDLPICGRNALLLGEVRYCQLQGSVYGIGGRLEHSLLDLAGLARLRDRLATAARVSEASSVEAA
jgi:hypothetical protein